MKLKINGLDWDVRFVDRSELREGNDAETHYYQFTIKLANTLSNKMARLIFIHELTHAILDSQGRGYQKSMNIEDLCEFMSFNHDNIAKAVKSFEEWIKERKV